LAKHRCKRYLSAKAHAVAAYNLLAIDPAPRRAVAVAAANVHIHVATTAPPPAIGIDFDSGAPIRSAPVASASLDIDIDTGAAAAFGGALVLPCTFFTRTHSGVAVGFLRPGTLVAVHALAHTLAAAFALTGVLATTALAAAGSAAFSATLPACTRAAATAGLNLMQQVPEREGLGRYCIAAKSKHRSNGSQNQYIPHCQTSSRCPLVSLYYQRPRFEGVAALMTIVWHQAPLSRADFTHRRDARLLASRSCGARLACGLHAAAR
jgi:hypothetical protein